MLSVSQFSTHSKYSTVTVIELGLPISEFSTRISKFDAPTNSEHKFNNKKKSEIGFDLGISVITITLRSTAVDSLKVLYTLP